MFHKKGIYHVGGVPGIWCHRPVLHKWPGFPYSSLFRLAQPAAPLYVRMDCFLGWGSNSLKERSLDPSHSLDKSMYERGFRKAESSLN